MKLKWALYARFSSDLQNDQSVEDQFRLLYELVQREGGELVQYYSDYAISGASLNRPGIQSLIEDIQSRKFDVIAAEALDRISRDLSDTSHIQKLCKFHGIKIHTISEGVVSNLEVAFRGLQNQQYLEET